MLVEDGLSEDSFNATRDFVVNYSKLHVQTASRRLGYALDARFYETGFLIDEIQGRLPRLSVDDVNAAIRRHLQFDDLAIGVVTTDAEGFVERLLADEPSPPTYNTTVSDAVLAEAGKPLQGMQWAGAIDCVGGVPLANVLAQTAYGGAVAASGLTAGNGLPTTVLPFILRGVNLYGIDSVQTPIERRREVWQRIASDLKPAGLDTIGHDIGLDELDDVLSGILDGKAVGRAVVDLKRS